MEKWMFKLIPNANEDAHQYADRLSGWVLVIVIIALGVWLRFHDLGRQSLWQDEIHTVLYVNDSPSFAAVVQRVATWDVHGPLYYLLLRGHVAVLRGLQQPISEVNLRILSALLGSLALIAVWLLAQRIFTNPVYALGMLALAAASPYAVVYAQELRMYSLVQVLAPLALYFALCLWDRPGRQWLWPAAGFVGTCLLLLYSSLIGTFFVGGLGAAVLVLAWSERREHPARWTRVLLLGGLILAGYLPWLGVMWRQSTKLQGGISTGQVFTNPREFFKFAFENLMFHAWKIGPAFGAVSKAFRLLWPLGLLALWSPEGRREHRLVWLSFAVVFLLQYGATYGRPFHTGRYVSAWWPFALYFAVAAFYGLERALAWVRPSLARLAPWLLAGFMFACIWVSAQQLQYYFRDYIKENWREAVPRLNAMLGPDDAVLVFDDWQKQNHLYYGSRYRLVPAASVPPGQLPPGCRRLFWLGNDPAAAGSGGTFTALPKMDAAQGLDIPLPKGWGLYVAQPSYGDHQ
jgi:uncharacterized membrane protein